jgi:hypothetical protein
LFVAVALSSIATWLSLYVHSFGAYLHCAQLWSKPSVSAGQIFSPRMSILHKTAGISVLLQLVLHDARDWCGWHGYASS